jgi:hypothetical protein
VKKPLATLLFLGLALMACSGLAQPTATPVPTLTLTAVPTDTPVPTATSTPTDTPLPPTETLDATSGLNPKGKPAAEWQGIPIMPDAIAGDGDEESYVFTVKATPQQVQKYYDLELGKLGWHSLAAGEGEKSSLILIFMNDASETLSISIIAKGDESLVLLVK